MGAGDQGGRKVAGECLGLGDFVRTHSDEILREWEEDVRRLPSARDLARPALRSDIPQLLEQIAGMIDSGTPDDGRHVLQELAQRHPIERLRDGFDLGQLASELGLLRDCVIRLCHAHVPSAPAITEVRILARAIDAALVASIERFTEARDSTLVALDRIGRVALESRDLPDLLQRLLETFLDSSCAADAAAIMIRERDVLRVRAAIGLEGAPGFELLAGEGFAGRVAAERRPVLLRHASVDPLVRSDAIRRAGLRALFGVPVIDSGEVVGVAYMGSRTAEELSTQDMYLFETLAWRAASSVRQHVLRERAEHAAAEISAIIESVPAAIFIGSEHEITRANRTALALLGYESMAELDRPISELVASRELRDANTGARIPPAETAFSKALVEGTPQFRDVVLRKVSSNDELCLHCIAAPIVIDGKTRGAVMIEIDITERRRMEMLVRERELEFRSLADNIPQLAWMTDATGSIYWYNQRWFDFTGTTLEEVKGWGWHRVHHPEHLEHVTAGVRRVLERGEPWQDTFPLRGRDGRYRWFLSRATPVRDERGQIVHWFGTNTDVTEQRLLVNASEILTVSLDARFSLEQLAELLVTDFADGCSVDLVEGTSIVGVAVAHSDPVKLAVLQQWTTRYPVTPNQPRGVANVLRTGEPLFVADVGHELLVARAGEEDELAILRQLGISSYVVVPMTARGETIGAISLHLESKRHFTANEVETVLELGRRAGATIDHAQLYAEAREAVDAREELISIVSHDLRTPLGTIDLGASMALEAEPLGPTARRGLELVQRSARRMDRLLRDLLDRTSMRAGRLTMEPKPEPAAALLRDVVDAHRDQATRKGIELIRECHVADAYICCDRERLMQAFANLIVNAIKFCGPGDVVIVRGQLEQGRAKLEVTDTGPGIAAEELPHLFEPHWSAKRHAAKGTGLGLYICKGIVDAHRGHIAVDSKLGEGTTFTVTLPLAQRPELPC